MKSSVSIKQRTLSPRKKLQFLIGSTWTNWWDLPGTLSWWKLWVHGRYIEKWNRFLSIVRGK